MIIFLKENEDRTIKQLPPEEESRSSLLTPIQLHMAQECLTNQIFPFLDELLSNTRESIVKEKILSLVELAMSEKFVTFSAKVCKIYPPKLSVFNSGVVIGFCNLNSIFTLPKHLFIKTICSGDRLSTKPNDKNKKEWETLQRESVLEYFRTAIKKWIADKKNPDHNLVPQLQVEKPG